MFFNEEETQRKSAGEVADRLITSLPISRYRFTFDHVITPNTGHYSGSHWRGAFGKALRQSVCITPKASCNSCLLNKQCPYSSVFETIAPSGSNTKPPAPYLIAPIDDFLYTDNNQQQMITVTLIGNANSHLPFVIDAITSAARNLTPRSENNHLIEVQLESAAGSKTWETLFTPSHPIRNNATSPITLPVPPDKLLIEIATPLILKKQNKILSANELSITDLVTSIARRTQSLSHFYGSAQIDMNYQEIKEQANAVTSVQKNLQWSSYNRYSYKQKSEINMSGITGYLRLDGAQCKNIWPYLWLGQWLHVGKGAVMGLGKYRIYRG